MAQFLTFRDLITLTERRGNLLVSKIMGRHFLFFSFFFFETVTSTLFSCLRILLFKKHIWATVCQEMYQVHDVHLLVEPPPKDPLGEAVRFLCMEEPRLGGLNCLPSILMELAKVNRTCFLSSRISIFPGSSGSQDCLWCGRPGFDPWGGKIPWRREWQPTQVILPGEFHGESPWGCKRVGYN